MGGDFNVAANGSPRTTSIWFGAGPAIIGHNIAIYHRNADKCGRVFLAQMDLMRTRRSAISTSALDQDRPQRPKGVGTGYVAELLGLWSERIIPRLSDVE